MKRFGFRFHTDDEDEVLNWVFDKLQVDGVFLVQLVVGNFPCSLLLVVFEGLFGQVEGEIEDLVGGDGVPCAVIGHGGR